jgi:hypothetical protein
MTSVLVDRAVEAETVEQVLAAARDGLSGVLVLRGSDRLGLNVGELVVRVELGERREDRVQLVLRQAVVLPWDERRGLELGDRECAAVTRARRGRTGGRATAQHGYRQDDKAHGNRVAGLVHGDASSAGWRICVLAAHRSADARILTLTWGEGNIVPSSATDSRTVMEALVV